MRHANLGSRAYIRPGPVPKIPQGLEELMEGLTKEVLRNNPTDIHRFCANHIEKLIKIRSVQLKPPPLTLDEKIAIAQKRVRERALKRNMEIDKKIKYFKSENLRNSNKFAENEIKLVTEGTKSDIGLNVHSKMSEVVENNNVENLKVTPNVEIVNNTHNAITKPSLIMSTEEKNTLENDKQVDFIEDIPSANIDAIITKSDKILEYNNLNKEDINMPIKTLRNYLNSTYQTQNNVQIDDVAEAEQSVNPDEEVIINKKETDIAAENVGITSVCVEDNVDNKLNILVKNEVKEIDNGDLETDVITQINELETEKKNRDNLLKSTEFEEIIDNKVSDMSNLGNSIKIAVDVDQSSSIEIDDKQIEKIPVNDDNILISDNDTENDQQNKNLRHETCFEQPKENNSDSVKIINETDMLTKKNDLNNDEASVNMSTDLEEILKNTQIKKQNDINDFDNIKLHINNNLQSVVKSIDDEKIKDIEHHRHTTIENNISIKTVMDNGNDMVMADKSFDSNISPEAINVKEDSKLELNLLENVTDLENIKEHTIPDASISDVIIYAPINNEQQSQEKILEIQKHEGKKDSDFVEQVIDQLNHVHENNNVNQDNPEIKRDFEDHEFEMNLKSVNKEENNIFTEEKKSETINNTATYNGDQQIINVDNTNKKHNEMEINSSESIDEDYYVLEKNNSLEETIDKERIIDNTAAPKVATMDLETAAITIQKVFRTFLFKSRTSTLDDIPNYEGSIDMSYMPIDESPTEKEKNVTEDEYNVTIINNDRRTLGINRMDTVLQTVNEEKSLSLSTDDSSTLSSAATTIQAHVRGYLARSRLNSNKTNSFNSVVNSEGPATSVDFDSDQKNKTVLNIHIVPEYGIMNRDESLGMSVDLPSDASPPSSNLHPLGYDKSERRKQLKREDAIQSVSPPSNNSGKLSEDVESVKEMPINGNKVTIESENIDINSQNAHSNELIDNKDIEILSTDSTPTISTTVETVIEELKDVSLNQTDSPEVNSDKEVNSRKHLTKQSSDETDVITPFTPNEVNNSRESEISSKLLHSGEFHDLVLPTRVSRNDSSVVRGE